VAHIQGGELMVGSLKKIGQKRRKKSGWRAIGMGTKKKGQGRLGQGGKKTK